MSRQSYMVITGLQNLAQELEFDTNTTVEAALDQAITTLHLPLRDNNGEHIHYGFAYGQFPQVKPMSGNTLLREYSLTHNDRLYLINVQRPWWNQTQPLPPLQNKASAYKRPYLIAGFGMALVVLLILGALQLFSRTTKPVVSATTPATIQTSLDQATAMSNNATQSTILVTPSIVSETTNNSRAGSSSATNMLVPPSTIAPTVATAILVIPSSTLSPSLTPVPSVTVQGALPQYKNRNPRLFLQTKAGAFGAYLWQDPKLTVHLAAPEGNVVLSNGDQIEIINTEISDLYQVRILSNVLDGTAVLGAEGWIARWIVDNANIPLAPTVTPLPKIPVKPTSPPTQAKKLRFFKLNENDQAGCISIQIQGISTKGWTFRVNGLRLSGKFQGGDARVCGLGADQEVTFSIYDANGRAVPGGGGVPTKGHAIMVGVWK